MTKTANTQIRLGVDQKIRQGYTQAAMEEGFGSASGVRPQTASSGGQVTNEEVGDEALQTGKVRNHFEDENSGLADN